MRWITYCTVSAKNNPASAEVSFGGIYDLNNPLTCFIAWSASVAKAAEERCQSFTYCGCRGVDMYMHFGIILIQYDQR